MKKVDIETKKGNIPIDPKIVNKYGLEKGTRAPFTGDKLVGENGEFPPKITETKTPPKMERDNGDGISEMDGGFLMSTSEVIDFSEGTDSSNR